MTIIRTNNPNIDIISLQEVDMETFSFLSPSEQLEYMQLTEVMHGMERQRRKHRIEEERRKKVLRNPVYRLVALTGIAGGA